jgi:hypothetical protein
MSFKPSSARKKRVRNSEESDAFVRRTQDKERAGCGARLIRLCQGILSWVIGDRSAETFKRVWSIRARVEVFLVPQVMATQPIQGL